MQTAGRGPGRSAAGSTVAKARTVGVGLRARSRSDADQTTRRAGSSSRLRSAHLTTTPQLALFWRHSISESPCSPISANAPCPGASTSSQSAPDPPRSSHARADASLVEPSTPSSASYQASGRTTCTRTAQTDQRVTRSPSSSSASGACAARRRTPTGSRTRAGRSSRRRSARWAASRPRGFEYGGSVVGLQEGVSRRQLGVSRNQG